MRKNLMLFYYVNSQCGKSEDNREFCSTTNWENENMILLVSNVLESLLSILMQNRAVVTDAS